MVYKLLDWFTTAVTKKRKEICSFFSPPLRPSVILSFRAPPHPPFVFAITRLFSRRIASSARSFLSLFLSLSLLSKSCLFSLYFASSHVPSYHVDFTTRSVITSMIIRTSCFLFCFIPSTRFTIFFFHEIFQNYRLTSVAYVGVGYKSVIIFSYFYVYDVFSTSARGAGAFLHEFRVVSLPYTRSRCCSAALKVTADLTIEEKKQRPIATDAWFRWIRENSRAARAPVATDATFFEISA